MSQASVGTKYERRCRKLYEAAGYDVIRAAASKGGADLIASNEYRIVFIQVKKSKKVYDKRAAAIRELQAIRAPRGGYPELVWRLVWIWVEKEGWTIINVQQITGVVCTSQELELLSRHATLSASRGANER